MRLITFAGPLAMAAALALASGCAGIMGPEIPLLSRTGLEDPPVAMPAVPPQPTAPQPPADPAAPPKHFIEFDLAPAVLPGELRFQPGDSIKVTIWGYPELDHIAVVQPNGRITIPLVGEIEAANATVSELRGRIFDELQRYTKAETKELRPGDTLTMEVWQRTELRTTAVVAPDGSVTFPLVGRLPAAGRPVEEIRAAAQARMLEYLRDARVAILPNFLNRRVLYDYQVSVLPGQLEPRRVAVVGEVQHQGLREIRGSLRVVQALAQAEVFNRTANLNSVIVIRNPESGSPQYRKLRIEDYYAGAAPDQNIYLQNGDIVLVPMSAITQVNHFIDQFFSRTMPVFLWWNAAWQASVASQAAETTRLINDSLRQQIRSIPIVVTP